MKQRVKRRQERQEKRSSWKRSWEGRKSWMQGVGRRKRGETRGGGIGWLNQCTLPLQILSTLSLSHSNKHTNTQWLNLCQNEVRSPPFPPSLQQPSYPAPVHVCVCGSLNHSSLTFFSRWRIDCWDTETEKVRGIIFGSEHFWNFFQLQHLQCFSAFRHLAGTSVVKQHHYADSATETSNSFWDFGLLSGTKHPQAGDNRTF